MTTIPMQPVTSSQIESVGFQDGTLAVKFLRGGLYHYTNVPQQTFADMLKAESIGKYFALHIKTHFHYKKMA
jgi:hypothetical protein